MGWAQTLAAELAITLADGSVWLSIGQGLLFGAVCLLFGIWVARFVGLLRADAPAGETLGVGLASGLLVLAAWWAAIVSGGRSSFTPVAIGFAIALGLAVVRRWRRSGARAGQSEISATVSGGSTPAPSARRGNLFVAVLGGAVFVVAVALLYGSTLIQSPRDGVQPLEFTDVAFYSVLGRDLATSGTETIYSPSGFDRIEGLPSQTWYHWGEIWLTAAAITIFGSAPLEARHFIVLPLLVLAAAAMTGTLVRRLNGSSSRGGYVFGFLACIFLAPIPVIQAGHFSSWAMGLIFGITMYGLAAVAALLSMYMLTVLRSRPPTWALAVFAGSAAVVILPAHVVIAVLSLVGIGAVWVVWVGRSLLATQRLPPVTRVWRRTYAVSAFGLVVTVVWGILTGHGAVTSAPSPGVSPFNESWRDALAIAILGAGAILAIAVAWFMSRRSGAPETGLYLGTAAALVAGALGWGARVGDFNSFHLFYAALAIFAATAAAVAVWSIWLWLRATAYRRLAAALLLIGVLQIEVGIGLGTTRLQEFGPGALPPVPMDILATIRNLPLDAKLAYACLPTEEQAFWAAQLLSLNAHTGRAVVPLCFEAEYFAKLFRVPPSADVASPNFVWAPQHQLYSNPQIQPSPADVASFLRANGIDYIYADAMHPNALIPDAVSVARSGESRILRVP